jgi:hypothetical protein
MKIKLTEGQIKSLIEAELYYGDEKLPELIREIQKDIAEGKKYCGEFLNILKSLEVSTIIDNPSVVMGVINKMEKTHKMVYGKWNKYYDILNTYDNDFDNAPLQQFDSLHSDYDTIQNDMENIKDKLKEIVEMFVEDNGEMSETFKYYVREYPTQTIELN